MPAPGTDEGRTEGSEDLPQVPACGTRNRSVPTNITVEGDKDEVPEGPKEPEAPKVPAHGTGNASVQPPYGRVDRGGGEKEAPKVPAYETGSRSVPSNRTVEGDKEEVSEVPKLPEVPKVPEAPKVPAHGTGNGSVQSPHGTVERGGGEKSKVPAHRGGSQRLPPFRIAEGGKNEAPWVPPHESRIEGVPQQRTREAVRQDLTHGAMKGKEAQVSIQLAKHEINRGGDWSTYKPKREGDPTVSSAHGTGLKAGEVLLQDPTGAPIREKNGAPQVPAKPTSGREMPKEYKTKIGETSLHKVHRQVLANKMIAETQEKSRAAYPMRGDRAIGESQERSRGVYPVHTDRTNQERGRGVSPVRTNKAYQERSRGMSPVRTNRTHQERSRGTSPVHRTHQERSKGVSPMHTDRTNQESSRGVSPVSIDRLRGGSQSEAEPRPTYGTEMRNRQYKN